MKAIPYFITSEAKLSVIHMLPVCVSDKTGAFHSCLYN